MTYETSELSLPAGPPFRLDLTVWALRRRKTNIVDQWDGNRYTRVIVFNNDPVKITAIQTSTGNQYLINARGFATVHESKTTGRGAKGKL